MMPSLIRHRYGLSFLLICAAAAACLPAASAVAQEARKGMYVVPDRSSGEKNDDTDAPRRDRDLGLRGRDSSSSSARSDDFRNERAPLTGTPRPSEPAQTLSDRPAPFGIQGRDQPANSWAR